MGLGALPNGLWWVVGASLDQVDSLQLEWLNE